MLVTPDLPLMTMYEPPPFVRRDQRDYVASITPDLNVITLPTDTRSVADARRESLAARAIEELRRYGRFRAGWDGYHGLPFSDGLIAEGVAIVEIATSLGRVQNIPIDAIIPGPASDGSIDIEFKRCDKVLIITMYPGAAEAEVCREVRGDEAYQMVRNEPLAMVPHLVWLVS